MTHKRMDRQSRRTMISLIVALVLLPALLLGRSGALRSSSRDRYLTSWETVVKVIDGDTLRLAGGERVRIKSIDAPELHEGKPGHAGPFPEPGAREAADALRAMVEGRRVKVVRKGHDHYDRTLAGIYLEDGTDVARQLLERGLVRRYK